MLENFRRFAEIPPEWRGSLNDPNMDRNPMGLIRKSGATIFRDTTAQISRDHAKQ
jgi:hypothetical protein